MALVKPSARSSRSQTGAGPARSRVFAPIKAAHFKYTGKRAKKASPARRVTMPEEEAEGFSSWRPKTPEAAEAFDKAGSALGVGLTEAIKSSLIIVRSRLLKHSDVIDISDAVCQASLVLIQEAVGHSPALLSQLQRGTSADILTIAGAALWVAMKLMDLRFNIPKGAELSQACAEVGTKALVAAEKQLLAVLKWDVAGVLSRRGFTLG